jgi:hypothetical protein
MDKPWNFRYILLGASGDATRRYFPCLAYGIQLLMPGLPYTYQRCGWLEERSVQRVPKGGFSGFALYRRFIKHFVPYTSLLS